MMHRGRPSDLGRYISDLEQAIRGAFEAALDHEVVRVLEILEPFAFRYPPILPRGGQSRIPPARKIGSR